MQNVFVFANAEETSIEYTTVIEPSKSINSFEHYDDEDVVGSEELKKTNHNNGQIEEVVEDGNEQYKKQSIEIIGEELEYDEVEGDGEQQEQEAIGQEQQNERVSEEEQDQIGEKREELNSSVVEQLSEELVQSQVYQAQSEQNNELMNNIEQSIEILATRSEVEEDISLCDGDILLESRLWLGIVSIIASPSQLGSSTPAFTGTWGGCPIEINEINTGEYSVIIKGSANPTSTVELSIAIGDCSDGSQTFRYYVEDVLGSSIRYAVRQVDFVIDGGNKVKAQNCANLFYSLNLDSRDLSGLDTSLCTNFNKMYYDNGGKTDIDVSMFDTSSAINMQKMFGECNAMTTLAVSGFDTSNVTDMSYMFQNCSALTSLNVSNFNTSIVTDMHGMFFNCSELTSLNLANFDTSQVTDLGEMFYNCINLTKLDLSTFNTANASGQVTNMLSNLNALTSIKFGVNSLAGCAGATQLNNLGLKESMWHTATKEYATTADMLSAAKLLSGSTTETYIVGSLPLVPPSPIPVPSSGGGGGGTIDPAGKPLDPQIVGPGIITNPNIILNPNMNVIPGTPMPNNTKVNINYDSSMAKKVVVSKAPSVNYDESDNLRLYLTGEDGVTYIANYGFYDVEVKNGNVNHNGIIDTYYVNEASNLVIGWVETANQNRYFMENAENNNTGKMCHGWKKIVNDWYYFDYDGKMMKNTKTYDGFTVDKDGRMTNPTYLDKTLINGKQKRTVYSLEKSIK